MTRAEGDRWVHGGRPSFFGNRKESCRLDLIPATDCAITIDMSNTQQHESETMTRKQRKVVETVVREWKAIKGRQFDQVECRVVEPWECGRPATLFLVGVLFVAGKRQYETTRISVGPRGGLKRIEG